MGQNGGKYGCFVLDYRFFLYYCVDLYIYINLIGGQPVLAAR